LFWKDKRKSKDEVICDKAKDTLSVKILDEHRLRHEENIIKDDLKNEGTNHLIIENKTISKGKRRKRTRRRNSKRTKMKLSETRRLKLDDLSSKDKSNPMRTKKKEREKSFKMDN